MICIMGKMAKASNSVAEVLKFLLKWTNELA